MDRPLPEREETKDAAETERARRASGVSADGAWVLPDPEVPEGPKRRQFSPEYRLRILREADACKASGGVGALLRREGLYSSHLTLWRRQRQAGALSGMRAKKRGPKGRVVDPRVKQLEKENARLQRRLKQAEMIIEIQKKVAAILGIPLKSHDSEGDD
jgi:transposase